MMTAAVPRPPATADDESLLAVECPECGVAIAVERSLATHPARCPLCRGAFIVPPLPQPRSRAAGDTPEEEQRRHTAEDRSRRRARRNILMLVAGVAILLVIVLTLGSPRPKQRR